MDRHRSLALVRTEDYPRRRKGWNGRHRRRLKGTGSIGQWHAALSPWLAPLLRSPKTGKYAGLVTSTLNDLPEECITGLSERQLCAVEGWNVIRHGSKA